MFWGIKSTLYSFNIAPMIIKIFNKLQNKFIIAYEGEIITAYCENMYTKKVTTNKFNIKKMMQRVKKNG